MGNATKCNRFFEWYLCDVWEYEIKDSTGAHNLVTNIMDAVVCLIYFIVTIAVLWMYGIKNLSFVATVLLVVRSIFKYHKLYSHYKRSTNQIALAFKLRKTIYFTIIGFLCVLYLSIKDENIGKVLLSLCYAVSALFELTDILVDCFDATPRLFTGA